MAMAGASHQCTTMLIARGGIDAMLAGPCAPATSSDGGCPARLPILLVCYRPLEDYWWAVADTRAPYRKVARIIRRKGRGTTHGRPWNWLQTGDSAPR